MRILVTGAGGFIGRSLVPFLAAKGHDVAALRRGRGAATEALAEIWSWHSWPAGIEAVVHLAALNPGRGDPAGRDVAALHRANVEGTRALAERAAAEGVRRLVFLSTANVHATKACEPIRETSTPQPQSAYAASKLAAEAALREVAATTQLDVCVLRPPPVYGPGGRGAIASLGRLARLPVPLPIGDTRRRRSILGLDNCLDAIAFALAHPKATGASYLLADAEPLSPGEIVASMRRALGRRAMLLPAPPLAALARLAGKGEAFERLFGAFVLDASRIEAELGWRPRLTSEEGFRRMMLAEGTERP